MADGGIDTRTAHVSAEEALAMHASGRPGKLEIRVKILAHDLARKLLWRFAPAHSRRSTRDRPFKARLLLSPIDHSAETMTDWTNR